MTRELEAYRRESEALIRLLREIAPGDWAGPTRCPPLDVRMLVVHLIGQADGVADICARGPSDQQPEKDRLTWWDYDIAEDQAETVTWVLEAAQAESSGPLDARYESAVAAAIEAAQALSGDPVLTAGAGLIKLSEYLATRVLETTIHAMDVRDAVARSPAPTEGGLDVTLGILAGRLGADPLGLGFNGIEFALAATGRATLDESQRSALGPLADRLPLLA